MLPNEVSGNQRQVNFVYLFSPSCLVQINSVNQDGSIFGGKTQFSYSYGKLAGIRDEETASAAIIGNNMSTADTLSVSEYHTTTYTASTASIHVNPQYEGNYMVLDFEGKNSTRVIDRNDNWITYGFNNAGNPIYAYDQNGVAQNASYINEDGWSNNRVNSEASHGKVARNLLKNHSGERTGDSWVSGYGSQNADERGGVALYGANAFRILTETMTTGLRSIKQVVTLKPNTTYTLSGYIRLNEYAVTEGGGAYLMVDGVNKKSRKYTARTDAAIDNGWRREELTFTTNASTSYGIHLVSEKAKGWAYFDGIQLEEGETASDYNILENSSFDLSTYQWSVANQDSNDYLTSTSNTIGGSTEQVYRLGGNPAKAKNIQQTVNPGGTEKDILLISGWAYADSIPTGKNLPGQDRRFEITVQWWFDSGVYYAERIPFDPYIHGWQYISKAIDLSKNGAVSNKTVTRVTMYVCYYNNANSVWFDNFSLTRASANSYQYDSKGNLVSAKDLESDESMTYNSDDKLVKKVNPGGGSYEYTYYTSGNGKGQLQKATSEYGLETTFSYNSYGQATDAVLHGKSDTMQMYAGGMSYTGGGRSVGSVTDSQGLVTGMTTSRGLVLDQTDPSGLVTKYFYDNRDRNNKVQATVTNPANSQTTTNAVEYQYGKFGLDRIQHNDNYYCFTYDSFGNAMATSIGYNKNIQLSQNEYAPNNGHLNSTTYGNGTKISYTYDDSDRLIQKSGNGTFNYFYNDRGRLAKLRTTVGNNYRGTKTYQYDILGRLTRLNDKYLNAKNQEISFESLYQYDKRGNVQKQINDFTDFNGSKDTITHSFDNDNVFAQTTFVSGGTTLHITPAYDALLRLIENNLSSNSYSNLRQTKVFYQDVTVNGKTYKSERVSDFTNLNRTGDLPSFSYTYDAAGNIASVTNKGNGTAKSIYYQYDNLGQLVREDNQVLNQTIVYSYDRNGNHSYKVQYPYTRGTVGSGGQSKAYVYGNGSWKDQMTSYNGQAITYDAIGNPLTYRDGMQFTWKARAMDSATASDGTILHFSYGEDGLRGVKTVAGNKRIVYQYNGGQLLSQDESTQDANGVWQQGDQYVRIHGQERPSWVNDYDNNRRRLQRRLLLSCFNEW